MHAMTKRSSEPKPAKRPDGDASAAATPTKPARPSGAVEEIGGRDGPDPTRYGDYEKDGRCVDF